MTRCQTHKISSDEHAYYCYGMIMLIVSIFPAVYHCSRFSTSKFGFGTAAPKASR
jgi:hypothetical protein